MFFLLSLDILILLTLLRMLGNWYSVVMSDEPTVSCEISMQFLPTRLPIIVLWRVESQFPALREMIVSAMCLCGDKRILSSYCEDMNGLKNSYFFFRNTMPSFIFCGPGF
jgi:hypothetical protein